MPRFLAPIVGLPLLLALAACGAPAATGPAASGPAATSVAITLQEWAVGSDTSTVPAGEVAFHVTNQGPGDEHEFVVIKTDLTLIDLPTDANGAVDEDGEGIQIIDEVEEMAVGASEDLTVDLEPGAYVLICNIYDEEEGEAHYQEGMRTSLTVTE
jgi:uncharacterized cupredoxin-like copper-binding protein